MSTELKVSFVLPFFHKFDLFKRAVEHNPIYRDNGHEIVLVLDEPTEAERVADWARANAGSISSRVIVKRQRHDWRPPCIPINVGIRHSVGQCIAVLSPETIIQCTPARFGIHVDECLTGWSYSTGRLIHSSIPNPEIIGDRLGDNLGFGFIMAKACHWQYIRGFDEGRKLYGGDDDCVRRRMMMAGVCQLIDPELKLVHLRHDAPRRNKAEVDYEPLANTPIVNGEEWGTSFGECVWDWRKP